MFRCDYLADRGRGLSLGWGVWCPGGLTCAGPGFSLCPGGSSYCLAWEYFPGYFRLDHHPSDLLPLACQCVLRLRVLPHEEFKVLLETVAVEQAVGFVLSWMHRVF